MRKLMFAAAALMFASCAATDNAPLEQTTWKLTELSGEADAAYAAGDSFTFTLDEGRISGKGSVNRFFGDYELVEDVNGLMIGEMGATKMMGPDIDLEDEFLRMFYEVNAYKLEGNVLTLLNGDTEVAKFEVWTGEESEEPAPAGFGVPVITLEEAEQMQPAQPETEE